MYGAGELRFTERARLEQIEQDTALVIVAGNSVRQHQAALSNADGVRRVRVPLTRILPDVPLVGRRVLVRGQGIFRARAEAGAIMEDDGNTVVVQLDSRPGHNGRTIESLDRLYTAHGRPLIAAMTDEAAGAQPWETDYTPALPDEVRTTLEGIAQRYEALDRSDDAAAVVAMLRYPSVELLLSPTADLERLTTHVDSLERPSVDLSVKGVTAIVTAARVPGGWGYQYRYRYSNGDKRNAMPARDHFTGVYPTAKDAQRAGAAALALAALPDGQEYSVKAQATAAARLRRRLDLFSR